MGPRRSSSFLLRPHRGQQSVPRIRVAGTIGGFGIGFGIGLRTAQPLFDALTILGLCTVITIILALVILTALLFGELYLFSQRVVYQMPVLRSTPTPPLLISSPKGLAVGFPHPLVSRGESWPNLAAHARRAPAPLAR